MRKGYQDWLLYEDGVHYTFDPETAVHEGFRQFAYEARHTSVDTVFPKTVYCHSYEQAARLVNHWNRGFTGHSGWFYHLKP